MRKPHLYSACIKKKAYSTLEYAERVVARARHERGVDLRVYCCNYCQRFHLTKNVSNGVRPVARPLSVELAKQPEMGSIKNPYHITPGAFQSERTAKRFFQRLFNKIGKKKRVFISFKGLDPTVIRYVNILKAHGALKIGRMKWTRHATIFEVSFMARMEQAVEEWFTQKERAA